MKAKERKFVENLLKQTMYSITNQFISTEVIEDIENENSVLHKQATLEKAHAIIDKEIPKVIEKLEKIGITKLEDFNEKQDTVSKLIGKLEEKMRKNAEELSKS